MSLVSVVDAIAVKAKTVSGVKDAYGAGVAGSGVTPMVTDPLQDTPVVLVLADTGSITTSSGQQQFTHRIVMEVWLSTANATDDWAYREGITFIEAFRVAWLTGTSLGSANQTSYLTGYGPLRPEDVDEFRPFLVVPIYLTVLEWFSVTVTT